MRLPKIRQLTEAQKKVYLYAPTDKHVLVQGPPGTGKTIIACFRAIELKKRNVPVVLGMFSRVLTRYASNAGQGDTLPSRTVHSWFRDWWSRCGVPPHPAAVEAIALETAYADKDEVKAAGAKWDPQAWRPWGGGKGTWTIDVETLRQRPEAFSRWRAWHSPPVLEDNPNRIDWAAVADHLLEHEDLIPDDALNLGTLLIDEGQDFPPGFYRMLQRVSAIAAARGDKVSYPARCFVLADENQQLTEDKSTLEDIATGLKIAKEHQYTLLDNFRNTKEIAELARSFFSDVGVLPNIPKRSGERPTLSLVASSAQVVARVRTWLTNNPGKEVGVLAFDDSTRSLMAETLERSLRSMKGREIRVQTYSWKSRAETKVNDLLFDTPDVVTVLNLQSCKGLEFDAVFIVDLHKAQIAAYGADRFRMQMFVATSRGRDWVELVDSGPSAGIGPWTACLPAPELLVRTGGNAREQQGTPASRPLAPVRSHGVDGIDAGDAWLARLRSEAGRRAFEIDDRRPEGGAIWVYGGKDLTSLLEPQGFAYSEKRSGWWRR